MIQSVMRILTVAATAAGFVIVLAGTPSGQTAAVWPLTVKPLALAAPPGSGQPQLSVSARGALVSWIERTGDAAMLKWSERTRDGWSAPRTVASGNDWFVNWADVPSVMRAPDGSLAAHWLQKSGSDTYAYDVRLAFSSDDGTTWTRGVTPHSDGTRTEHGFGSLFPMPDRGLGLVWLDGRAMTAGHGDHGGGDMSLRYGAFGRDRAQRAETAIDTRVCECCPTASAITADGPIVAYRDRGPDNRRDIYVARLVNGTWSAGAPVHDDGWIFPACPVNGPALSARGRDVVIAWYTGANGVTRSLAAFSTDAGRTFGAPIVLDGDASLGRVGVALLPDGSAAASYIAVTPDKRAEFRVRRIEKSGAASAPVTIAAIDAGRTSGYPRIAVSGQDLVFVWIEGTRPTQVRTAVAAIPRP